MSNFFLTFDNATGDILGIENLEPNGISYITASLEQVTPFLEGTENTSAYTVTFDSKTKEYILKARVFEETLYTGPNDTLYEVPWQAEEADINIRFWRDTSKWEFYLGNELAKSLNQQKSVIQNELTFFITKYKNPNILIDTISVMPDPKKRIVMDLKIDVDTKFSVYTKRRFESYGVDIAI